MDVCALISCAGCVISALQGGGGKKTNLPKHNSSLDGSHHQDVPSESQTSYSLRKGYEGLLVPAKPRVDMDVCLVVLGGKDMGITDSQAVWWRGTLLEGGFCSKGWPQRVRIDAHVFGNGRVARQRGAVDGREEVLCHHLFLSRQSKIDWFLICFCCC